MMHHIQFEFKCSRPVPLYEYLCQQFIAHPKVAITAAQLTDDQFNTRYIIEASAEQAQLEQLAEEIAEHFLLSVWLLDTRIQRIEQKQFLTSKQLNYPKASYAPLPYCQQCQPRFGDNQHNDFANINLECSHCHGHQQLSLAQKGLTPQDIKAFAEILLNKDTLYLPDDNMTLSIAQPVFEHHRPSILVCNPNALNSYFHLCDEQVIALSSIEKPCLRLNTNEAGLSCLKVPLVDVQFAHNRLLVILCELLRQRGINWLYSHSNPPGEHHCNPPLRLARLEHQWVAKQHVQAGECNRYFTALHDDAESLVCNMHYSAFGQKDTLKWTAIRTQNEQIIPKSKAAHCALLAGLQAQQSPSKCKKPKHAAVLFLSRHQTSQIVTLDKNSQAELFFEFPAIPRSGYEVCHALSQSREKDLLNKFKQAHPEDYNALLDIELSSHSQSLTSFMTVAAAIIGCQVNHDTPESVTQQLADSFVANAMIFNGANAPRIDFPLIKGEANRSINWCKTLGTLMSFKLAGETDIAKLAFAFHDSLADYLSHWIEHVDKNIGINHLVLAGSEFDNPVLAQQICLRVGKNTQILINKQLDLEGANLAIGGLFLPQRRSGF
ncbi:Kae1-like domain-containing protein [Shewanella gaetbuli]